MLVSAFGIPSTVAAARARTRARRWRKALSRTSAASMIRVIQRREAASARLSSEGIHRHQTLTLAAKHIAARCLHSCKRPVLLARPFAKASTQLKLSVKPRSRLPKLARRRRQRRSPIRQTRPSSMWIASSFAQVPAATSCQSSSASMSRGTSGNVGFKPHSQPAAVPHGFAVWMSSKESASLSAAALGPTPRRYSGENRHRSSKQPTAATCSGLKVASMMP